MVLALLVAAFVAGWLARDPPFARRRSQPSEDPVDAARAWLDRAVAAGVDPVRLGRALEELDRIDPELEGVAGGDGATYREFDRAINQAHFLHRALTGAEGGSLPATMAAADELAAAARRYRRATDGEAPEVGHMSDRRIS